jgi:hypothetical protein
MPTVGDLIHSLDNAKVLSELARLYQGEGEDLDGYAEMWLVLKDLRPKLTKMSVLLSRRWSDDDPSEPCVDISGVETGDPQQYAIEYIEWQEWLSMPVIVAAELQPMGAEEQLAHCLYEMTWAGYRQEDIAEQKQEIVDSVAEVEELIKNQATHSSFE